MVVIKNFYWFVPSICFKNRLYCNLEFSFFALSSLQDCGPSCGCTTKMLTSVIYMANAIFVYLYILRILLANLGLLYSCSRMVELCLVFRGYSGIFVY